MINFELQQNNKMLFKIKFRNSIDKLNFSEAIGFKFKDNLEKS
jgi:hypothetical protein